MSALKLATSFGIAEISVSEYQFFADKMMQLTGVSLPENSKNRALMLNRLSRLIRKLNLSSYAELIKLIQQERPDTIDDFVSALTTNKTDFFREIQHFTFLKQYLVDHFSKKQNLRIWCSAASTGAEPYTIAMVVKDTVNPIQVESTKILATDIDLEALDHCRQGVYQKSEISGLGMEHLNKYFKKKQDGFEIKSEILKMVHFSQFNLTHTNYRFKNQFDVIFCRNVLIYFEPQMVSQVIDMLVGNLSPGGYLILGQSEAGCVKGKRLQVLGNSIFKKI
jgi:chemotaxis protein methyltransferase CheR